MKFKLDAVKKVYKHNDSEVKALKSLGFLFSDLGEKFTAYPGLHVIIDTPTIEIDTLEQLQEFIAKWGTAILDGETLTLYNAEIR